MFPRMDVPSRLDAKGEVAVLPFLDSAQAKANHSGKYRGQPGIHDLRLSHDGS